MDTKITHREQLLAEALLAVLVKLKVLGKVAQAGITGPELLCAAEIFCENYNNGVKDDGQKKYKEKV